MVSIIIVNYHVSKELFTCIQSVIKSNPKTEYEIIVVDNDERKKIQEKLRKKFPKVIYIENENKGLSQAGNVGAKYAKGKNLFFLNPDTIVYPKAIDNLTDFLSRKSDIGIIAPLLYDKSNNSYKLQGIKELTPFRAIFSLSFINKLFPKNKIYQEYYLFDWNKKDLKEVDAVPGTAFMIRKNIYEKSGGLDESFFLYFEEFDLCKRVRELGWRIYIYPKAKVFHAWGLSTKKRDDVKKIFLQSRFYYFKKHFGIIPALFTEAFLRINKYTFIMLSIMVMAAFLRLYRINETMPFIGDQGWFYLSARDLLLYGKIPLVGITSSHTWLHQGPLWTYMLAIVLWLFNYNPVSGAYFTAFLGIITIIVSYLVTKSMFSEKIALISSLLYASSPIIVSHSRMSYHISPIPLFVVLFIYCLHKLFKGNVKSVPIIIFLLSILYNLELATVILWFVFPIVVFFVLKMRIIKIIEILNKKIFLLSIIGFIIPMFPILLYDVKNGFPQTVKFAAWISYRILNFILNNPIDGAVNESGFIVLINFWNNFTRNLLFSPNMFLSSLLFIFGFFYLMYIVYKQYKNTEVSNSHTLIFVTLIVSLAGFFVNNVPSEAYVPIFFPTIILTVAIMFDGLMKHFKKVTFVVIIIMSFLNSYVIISQLNDGMKKRIEVSKKIVKEAKGKKYNLIGKGEGSEFESFTMNYEYLTWWLGNSPEKKSQQLKFVIIEDSKGIHLIRN